MRTRAQAVDPGLFVGLLTGTIKEAAEYDTIYGVKA